MNRWMLKFAPLREMDGGGTGGTGDANGGEPGSDGGWQPPTGIPEEFRGSTADETLAKLLPAFSDVTSRVEGLRSKLATMPKAPDTVDGYSFEAPDKLKPWFSDLDKSPIWPHAREAAKAVGLSNEQFGQFISGVYGPMVDAGLIAAPFNPQAEIESFSKAYGLDKQGTQQALVQAETFAKGLTQQLKVPEAMKADVSALVTSLADTAAGNALLQALSGRLSDSGFRIAGESTFQGALTDEEVQRLHSDPRIDPRNRDAKDASQRYDPDLRRRYDEACNRPKR